MLAVNHVTLATGVVLAGSVLWNEPFFLPFIAFVVFAALLPDIDHPGSEVSKIFPVIGRVIPHRGITHSFVGIAIFSGAMYLLLGHHQILSLVLLIAAFIGLFFLEKILVKRVNQLQHLSGNFFSNKQMRLMLRILSGILSIFLLSLVFLIWQQRFRIEILILLTLGFAAHILGDFVTKEGVPLFWPIKKKLGLKLFRTGSTIEVLVGVGLLIINVYFFIQFIELNKVLRADYWQSYLG